jgi:hypothetical protein
MQPPKIFASCYQVTQNVEMALLQKNERASLSPVVTTELEVGDESMLQRYRNEPQAA